MNNFTVCNNQNTWHNLWQKRITSLTERMKTFTPPGKFMLLALLCLLITGNGVAQSNSLQSATGNTAGTVNTTFTVNLASAPSNGNTLIAVISTRGNTASRVSSITQTGVTWTRVVQRTNGSGVTTEIWYASNTVSAGVAVTINLAASLRAAAVVMEYSGVLIPDATATQSAGNSTPSTGTPWDGTKGIPTTQENEVWVGGISVSLANGDRTLSGIYNDFSLIGGDPVTSGATTNVNTKLYALDRIVDFTQAPNSGGRLSGTAQWAGAIATFMKTTIARVQSSTGNSGTNGVNSFNVTLPNNTTIGNTLIAVISTRGTTAGRVSEITGGGATWIRAIEATRSYSSGNTTEIWYAPITSTSVPKTVTIILAATLRAAAVVMEYRGILTDVSPVDQTAVANGSSSTNPTVGPSALTTQENELWIGGIGYSSSSPTLGSLTNSFSEIANSASTSGTSSNNAKVYALEKIVTTTGTASTGGTLSSSVQWSGAIATFKTPIEAAPYCNIEGTSTPLGWTNTLFTGAGGFETTVPVNVTAISSNVYKGIKNSISIDVYAGENLTINSTTTNNGFNGLNCSFYADWNGDYDFDEPDEYLGNSSTGISSRSLTVPVPKTAVLGVTRVRVEFSADTDNSPCAIASTTNAMVCDFKINVKKWCPPDITGTVKNATCPEEPNGAITIDNVKAIQFTNELRNYIDFENYLLNNRSVFTLECWVKFDYINNNK